MVKNNLQLFFVHSVTSICTRKIPLCFKQLKRSKTHLFSSTDIASLLSLEFLALYIFLQKQNFSQVYCKSQKLGLEEEVKTSRLRGQILFALFSLWPLLHRMKGLRRHASCCLFSSQFTVLSKCQFQRKGHFAIFSRLLFVLLYQPNLVLSRMSRGKLRGLTVQILQYNYYTFCGITYEYYYLLRNATKRSRSHLTSRGSIISQGSLLSFPTFLCHNATKLEDKYNITTLHYLPHYIQQGCLPDIFLAWKISCITTCVIGGACAIQRRCITESKG